MLTFNLKLSQYNRNVHCAEAELEEAEEVEEEEEEVDD